MDASQVQHLIPNFEQIEQAENHWLPLVQTIATKFRNYLARPLRILVLEAKARHPHKDSTLEPQSADLILAFEQPLTKLSRLPQKNTIFLLVSCDYDLQELRCLFAYHEKIASHPELFFASNDYWYADGQLQRFTSWADFSHELDPDAHAHTRRYYFSEQLILKQFQFIDRKAQVNRAELANEIRFLERQSATVPWLPKLIHSKINQKDGWLLREKLSGTSLHKIISEGFPYDPRKILLNLLQQLSLLEGQGLYHTDLRTWNLLLNPQEEVRFIDYGSIQPTTTDMLHHRKHVLISFLLLAYEIIHRTRIQERQFTPRHIHPRYYPEEYRTWLRYLLATDFSQWSFSLFLRCLTTPIELPPKLNSIADAMQLWLEAIEPGVESPRYRRKYFEPLFIKRLQAETKSRSRSRLLWWQNPSPLVGEGAEVG